MSVRERLDLVECVLIPSHHCVISPKGANTDQDEKNAQNEKDPIFFIVVRNRPFRRGEYCCSAK